jgi:vacuolar-type H+-ATPase subunit F/Vma7
MAVEEHSTGAVVAIGDPARLAGYALAGVRVLPARTPSEASAAWRGMSGEVGLVLLTAAAAEAVGAGRQAPDGPLTVVMPG